MPVDKNEEEFLSEFQILQENEELRKTLQNLQRELAKAKRRNSEVVRAVEKAAKEASLIIGAPKAIKPPKDKRKKKEEIALLHLTDWQTGKRTSSYNSEILQKRIEHLTNLVKRIVDIQRADRPIKKLVILLGGDMVEGTTIFPGQAWEVDSTLYEQLFHFVSVLESLVRSFSEYFEEIDIWTEYGNHGRHGRKGEQPPEENFDLIGYRICLDRTSNLPNVTWHLSTDWYQIPQIGNYHPLLVHGDEIKSFGGQTPAFGIIKKVNAWSSGVLEDFTDCYMGHFHQPLTLPISGGGRTFVSPSTESGSEYAREFVAAVGRPGQRLNFIDPIKGQVTSEHLLWLDEV